MIQSNEVRRGNFTLTPRKLIVRIDTINENSFSAINKNSLRWYSKLYPIPITEDWILNFGGKKNDEEITIPINRNLYISFIDSECQLVTDDDFLVMDINHVHQLQNLYFSLTGEELTLSPN